MKKPKGYTKICLKLMEEVKDKLPPVFALDFFLNSIIFLAFSQADDSRVFLNEVKDILEKKYDQTMEESKTLTTVDYP